MAQRFYRYYDNGEPVVVDHLDMVPSKYRNKVEVIKSSLAPARDAKDALERSVDALENATGKDATAALGRGAEALESVAEGAGSLLKNSDALHLPSIGLGAAGMAVLLFALKLRKQIATLFLWGMLLAGIAGIAGAYALWHEHQTDIKRAVSTLREHMP